MALVDHLGTTIKEVRITNPQLIRLPRLLYAARGVARQKYHPRVEKWGEFHDIEDSQEL